MLDDKYHLTFLKLFRKPTQKGYKKIGRGYEGVNKKYN